jgi:hypothetical protein
MSAARKLFCETASFSIGGQRAQFPLYAEPEMDYYDKCWRVPDYMTYSAASTRRYTPNRQTAH